MTSIRLILDGLGGNHVEELLSSVVPRFLKDHPDSSLNVATTQRSFERSFDSSSPHERLLWLPCEDRIEFHESPVAALKAKPASSIALAMKFLKSEGDALVSFGHTGAGAVAAQMTLGLIPGVQRAGLAAILPHQKGMGILLDVGANLNARPEHLELYGTMANIYAQTVLNIERPRIGLLNIGEEKNKGDQRLLQSFDRMSNAPYQFIGNVEGQQIFDGSVDAIVCRGLEGNMVLKACEALANMMIDKLRTQLKDDKTITPDHVHEMVEALAGRVDPSATGACPLLGVDGTVFIGHGHANEEAIYHALRSARQAVLSGLQPALHQRLANP